MRTPILAGNWKMHKTVGEAKELAAALAHDAQASGREVVVCPPFTALAAVAEVVAGSPVALGAQDMHHEEQGAFTGAISPLMLRDLGCTYVILGHSERRQLFGETDASVNKKVHAALAHGLKPIVCVGETKPERDAGNAQSVVVGQLQGSLAGVDGAQMAQVVIAYEPVWAIGTGDTATPDDAQTMHAAIRATLSELVGEDVAATVRIQYGGSVKPDNVDELMAQPDIDGALVGGAALKADSFLRIVHFTA